MVLTAVADDAGAVFWNPAGLMQINGQSVAGALTLYPGEADDYETFAAYLAQDSGYGAGPCPGTTAGWSRWPAPAD